MKPTEIDKSEDTCISWCTHRVSFLQHKINELKESLEVFLHVNIWDYDWLSEIKAMVLRDSSDRNWRVSFYSSPTVQLWLDCVRPWRDGRWEMRLHPHNPCHSKSKKRFRIPKSKKDLKSVFNGFGKVTLTKNTQQIYSVNPDCVWLQIIQ